MFGNEYFGQTDSCFTIAKPAILFPEHTVRIRIYNTVIQQKKQGGLLLTDFLNLMLAWIAAIMIFLLSVIYPIRKYGQKHKLPQTHLLMKWNRLLRKIHKPLGIALIGVTFLHCRFSSQKLGFSTGTLCLVLTTVLFINYMARKQMKKHWMKIHRGLSLALLILLILHIILTRIFLGGSL